MSLIKPLITEKTLQMAERGTFTFLVNPKDNKHQVKAEVEAQFAVNVVKISTVKMASRKVKSRKTGRYLTVKPTKKAMVTLKAKQTIDLFNVKK